MSFRKPRPYNNGDKRPRMDPPGTRPKETRRATRRKQPYFGEVLQLRHEARQQLRAQRRQEAS